MKTLVFSVCNKTSRKVSAAIVRRSADDPNWWLQGWYSAEPGACKEISGIPKGYFYYYITQSGTNNVWTGNARRVCVDNRVVERVIFSKERCLRGETNAGFVEKYSLDDKVEISLVDKAT